MYPYIDPVAIHIGSWGIRWYGLAYLVGFLWVYYMSKYSLKNSNHTINDKQYEALITNLMLALLLGGRVGYILFYQFFEFIRDPIILFKIWQGGMSFHGACLGVVFAVYWQTKNMHISFFEVTDIILPWVPLGIGLGRLANFINGELWGRPTDVAWGMVFPWVDMQARHPSQLYEFLLEGVILSVVMYIFWCNNRLKTGQLTAIFLFFYGLFRFFVEIFREPDAQIGLFFSYISLGQILSVPMILLGGYFFYKSAIKKL